jgi:hypothetical protein
VFLCVSLLFFSSVLSPLQERFDELQASASRHRPLSTPGSGGSAASPGQQEIKGQGNSSLLNCTKFCLHQERLCLVSHCRTIMLQ